ncbi:MAG: hypothetical protein JWN48_2173 [Myxococcaceae bacterium]|nr:hypothetical protein [Myxococcaceae bacterium]
MGTRIHPCRATSAQVAGSLLTVLFAVSCGAEGRRDEQTAPDGDGGAQSAVDAGQGLDSGRPDASVRADATDATHAATVDGAKKDASVSDSDAAPACSEGPGGAVIDVVAVSAQSKVGGAPQKGDALQLTLRLENSGNTGARVKLTPLLESKRFSDYKAVPLVGQEVTLCQGSTELTFEGGPFLENPSNGKQYALGSGDYTVSVLVELPGQTARTDSTLEGASFKVATSNALLIPVIYDQRYFDQVMGETTSTPEAYLTQVMTRASELFTPSGTDPDGAGSYQTFDQGFDQMMNVRHLFKAFPGFPGADTTDQGWCEDAAEYARRTLKLADGWSTQSAQTRPERHGFDYLIALTPDMGGGVTCGWLDVQVSSLINRDLDRQQIVAVHETGHIFGAPHCDDVGNGSGGPLQGYVMCSGEKHPHYPAAFVWHATSRKQMKPHWD